MREEGASLRGSLIPGSLFRRAEIIFVVVRKTTGLPMVFRFVVVVQIVLRISYLILTFRETVFVVFL